jgi:TolB-like protein
VSPESETHSGVAGPAPAFVLDGTPVWPDANRIGDTHVEPKRMDVLMLLIDAAPKVVPLERLLAQVWPNVVVGDGVVHQAISHLRRALHDDPRHPRCIETIPRRGYRLVATVVPGPAAERLPTPAVDRAAAATADVVADAGHATQPDQTGQPAPLLAVLAFDNLSDDPALVFFSDGVSEEILQTVARTTGILVIGRSSTFQFRGADKAAQHVAAELGCSHILDGSVRRSGDRVRVSAQLVECDRQTLLWSARFDHDLDDVFVLQDQVAAAVAGALRTRFAPSVELGPVDPVAYEYYLKARASTSQWLGANDPTLLEQAIARVPTFARAWAALAVSRAIEAHVEADSARCQRARVRAIEAADSALRLDPTCGAAYVAQSIVKPVCGHFAERDALIHAALEVTPTDTAALFWAGRWSWTVGRIGDLRDYMARCYAVDPLWPQGVHQYASALAVVGQWSDANALWDQALARWPGLYYLHGAQIQSASAVGDWARVDTLLDGLRRSGVQTPEIERVLRHTNDLRHWQPADEQRLRERIVRQLERTGTVPLRLLSFACQIGLTDEAYALVERARFDHLFTPGGTLLPGDVGLHHLFSQFSRALREDERFVDLCARLGLCDYWVTTGRWPDCAEAVADRYDFRERAVKGASSENSK